MTNDADHPQPVLAAPWLVRLPALRTLLLLVVIVVAMTILTGGAFTAPDNLVDLTRQVSFEALIAFGMTFVVVTGGIDLSVGALVALTGVVAGLVLRATPGWSEPVAIGVALACAVAVGLAAGTLSGGVVTRFAAPPFIVTLAVMLVARGAASTLCAAQPVTDLPPALASLSHGFVAQGAFARLDHWLAGTTVDAESAGRWLPVPLLIMLIGFVVFHVLLTRTVFGRGAVAVGSNATAARLAGIPTHRTRILVYALTGGLCGLVGVLHDASGMTADPAAGQMWELSIIAAVVLGGTSLFGGRGTITGTLFGAFTIGALANGLTILGAAPYWRNVTLGAIILAAVIADAAQHRRDHRWGGNAPG
ncbi:MAG TPA: ABC transporter permease [Phycisphaerae bacterium]|nr:ABC transporter permease [Phycisphaerales bacterium]HRX86101.1 ABC transporter permease [Phycisphaerae bacterium]